MQDPGRLAICGPGLLGGSLALAARRLWPEADVRLWARREEAVDELRASGLEARVTSDLAEAVRGADLIVLATPVEVMGDLVRRIMNSKPAAGCVITDVGSVKGSVVGELTPLVSEGGGTFVGSHPMAGSEKVGFAAATADLFSGARCIVTPSEETPECATELVVEFWEALGCEIVRLDPESHDRAVARISHLPHVSAAALVIAALSGADPGLEKCIGSGFRDATRIASGSPGLWVGILRENREAVVSALGDLREQIGEVLAMVEDVDEVKLRKFLEQAKRLRESAL